MSAQPGRGVRRERGARRHRRAIPSRDDAGRAALPRHAPFELRSAGPSAGPARIRRDHDCQISCQAFVRLKVSTVQKFALLRYQTWYTRTSPGVHVPRTDTVGSPTPG